MNLPPWRWLNRLPGLLAPPAPEPEQQARRIIAVQRRIIPPAKLVAVAIVFYFLYSGKWISVVSSASEVVLDRLQRAFGFYVILSCAVITFFFVVRRFPPGLVQWLVFVVGLLDGLFLSGLIFITGGFDSVVYYLVPAVIVLNAICIPLATPQIVLNLALCAFYLGAGWIELNTRDVTASARLNFPEPIHKNFTSEQIAKDLPAIVTRLNEHSFPEDEFLWKGLTPESRNMLLSNAASGPGDLAIARRLTDELNRITARYVLTPPPASELPENPGEPYVLKVLVLVLLTFCCYGVQVLAVRHEIAEEERREFTALTERLQAAGRLSAEFAHQIKNPLAIINNTAFSLQRGLRTGKGSPEKQIEIIQEEVARADQVITQIMGYAQLNEGRVERLNVIEETDRAIQQVFPSAVPSGIVVKRRYAGSFPPLLMQRRHFSDTLVNLLQNAREAVGEKGHIQVTAQSGRDHSVEISVQDDGPGIPPEKQVRVFEAYYTTKAKGTGLGLAIVKHNVELYGGVARIDSELGKGAKFTLVFPAKSLMRLG